MRLIAYANDIEVEYIHYAGLWRWDIGFRCVNLHSELIIPDLAKYDDFEGIILFGSCGLLQRKGQAVCSSCSDFWNADPYCKKCTHKIKNSTLLSPKYWLMGDNKILRSDEIIMPTWGNGVTVDYSCRDRNKILREHPEAICVDQESFILAQWCKERGIKFQSVRYIIDKCGRMYPPVVNHFWRRFQHKRQQLKFLEVLK